MRSIPRRAVRKIARYGVHTLGLRQSDQTLYHDAQKYWGDARQERFQSNSHWRGGEGLPNEIWLELGKIHLSLFRDYAGMLGFSHPLHRIVEWGCGGGANAIHFAGETSEFVGVDVSQASLEECAKNLRDIGYDGFIPLLVDVSRPEDALAAMPGPCDAFLCTYVFELIPTPEYGERLLKIARGLLRPGGIALIQIKYETNDSRTKPLRWDYRSNLANMTTYPIDTFWQMSQQIGFAPKAITLRPKDNLVHDERYAYFVLENPASP